MLAAATLAAGAAHAQTCGDLACDPGETYCTCASDCAVSCGDGTCDGLAEDSCTCPEDCGGTSYGDAPLDQADEMTAWCGQRSCRPYACP